MTENTKATPQTLATAAAALSYYADPETYKNLRVISDPPCGDFRYDYADEKETFGQIARAVISHIEKLTGISTENAVDKDFMQSMGVDIERRYNPPKIKPGDPDYDPEWHEGTDCCNIRLGAIDGQIEIDKAPDSCPFCQSPENAEAGDGEMRSYVCGLNLFDCGHYLYGMFNFGEKCLYVQSLRKEIAGEKAPHKLYDQFQKEVVDADDLLKSSRMVRLEDGTVAFRVFVDDDAAKAPEEFEGVPVVLKNRS